MSNDEAELTALREKIIFSMGHIVYESVMGWIKAFMEGEVAKELEKAFKENKRDIEKCFSLNGQEGDTLTQESGIMLFRANWHKSVILAFKKDPLYKKLKFVGQINPSIVESIGFLLIQACREAEEKK